MNSLKVRLHFRTFWKVSQAWPKKMFKWWNYSRFLLLLLFVGLMILLFYPFFVWGEKTISAAGGDFPIQSIIFLHKAPMDYKMIWTTINLYRSLILARSLIMILFIHALCVCLCVQKFKTTLVKQDSPPS